MGRTEEWMDGPWTVGRSGMGFSGCAPLAWHGMACIPDMCVRRVCLQGRTTGSEDGDGRDAEKLRCLQDSNALSFAMDPYCCESQILSIIFSPTKTDKELQSTLAQIGLTKCDFLILRSEACPHDPVVNAEGRRRRRRGRIFPF